MPVLFVGLGPNGRDVTREQLGTFLGQFGAVQEVRCIGTRAFADVASDADAEAIIAGADKQQLGHVRLSVHLDRQGGAPAGGRDRAAGERAPRGQGAEGAAGTTLYVGLGPAGGSVTEEMLRARLAEAGAAVVAVRHRGACAFVDMATAQDAARAIEGADKQYIGSVRLAVRLDCPRGGVRGRGDDGSAPTRERRQPMRERRY
jgi:hypothetical protein